MPEHAYAFASKPAEASHNGIIVSEFAISGERDEIPDQGINIVQAMRPIRMAGHLGLLPGGKLGIKLFERP